MKIGDEAERGVLVINCCLHTGAAHFSAPCLATCSTAQWSTTQYTPEQPLCPPEDKPERAFLSLFIDILLP